MQPDRKRVNGFGDAFFHFPSDMARGWTNQTDDIDKKRWGKIGAGMEAYLGMHGAMIIFSGIAGTVAASFFMDLDRATIFGGGSFEVLSFVALDAVAAKIGRDIRREAASGNN